MRSFLIFLDIEKVWGKLELLGMRENSSLKISYKEKPLLKKNEGIFEFVYF